MFFPAHRVFLSRFQKKANILLGLDRIASFADGKLCQHG
jgi:hypothetical protein